MKKSVLLISAICAFACALSACGKKEVNAYDKLNSMLDASYSQITISIDNTYTEEEITLESVYMLIYSQSEITVQYKVERFAEFTLENPTTDVKTTYQGTAVIVGGIISGGSEVGLTADIADLSLEFKEAYFENITLDSGSLTADVKDVSAFLGTELVCTGMKVEAKFSDVLESITVTYSQSGHEVVYSYIFTR